MRQLYAGLDSRRHVREKIAMMQIIIDSLRPDYLTMETEPETMVANTDGRLDFSVDSVLSYVRQYCAALRPQEFRSPERFETHHHRRKSRRRCFALSGAGGTKGNRGVKEMKESTNYAKIVEWSPEDGCCVGSAPGLIFGGCHGDDEMAVFEEICNIAEEVIALYHSEGRTLPPATSGKDFANRMQDAA